MKNKIMIRLGLYFFVSFVIFSIIIGIVFSILFSRHNIDVHRAELERQVISISDILSETLATDNRHGLGGGRGMGMGMMDFNTYLRLIEEIVVCSIWIVDEDLEQIIFTSGRGHRHMQTQSPINPSQLPYYAEQTIIDALGGKSSTSESFSEFFGTPSITAAAPLSSRSGEVIGAVLLHSYVYNVELVNTQGITILLYSISGAIFMSIFVAAIFSFRFTKPLNKMKKVALQISHGNYSIETGIDQSDEIGELAVALDHMAGKLAKSSEESAQLEKLRRDFVANISHELRTPITVIRGSLEAICDGIVSDEEKVNSYNKQMLFETIHLERLVSDLLDLARLQNPDFTMEMQLVDLKDIVQDIVRSMKEIAERKDIRLKFACVGEAFAFTGDYGRLRQMFIIILDNAIKFSDAGKIVFINLTRNDKTISLIVKDEGLGISSDDLPHIFQRFHKERSEHNKAGTGLGLSIAKQIADRHGVVVKVESQLGKGTEFTFIFESKM